MSSVSSTTSTTSVTDRGTKIVTGTETDTDLFLKLLVAQMQNQDPFDTQDPTEYVTQLAQFSMLQELQSINSNVEYVMEINNALLTNSAMSDAASLIGKQVEAYAPNSAGEYDGETQTSGVVESASIKDGIVYLSIRDEDTGNLIDVEYAALIKVESTQQ
jgi:flagellar basal-body rod modification protein FlgD